MKPSSTACGWQTWWLEPRDPLVFGDGARVPALVPRHSGWLPPQPTLAGFVRSRFVAGQAVVAAEEAEGLLEISIRGPWLVEAGESEPSRSLWLPAPADAVLAGRDRQAHWLRGEPFPLAAGEGVNWPSGAAQRLVPVLLADRVNGEKTRRPDFPFWPFDDVVDWSLGKAVQAIDQGQSGRPIPEYRVHVQLDDDAGTAAPEALFSSGGVRYPGRFHLAVEVRDERIGGDAGQGPAPHQPPVLAILGAESRATRLKITAEPCFPCYESVRASFESAVEGWSRAGLSLGLRLQLLTPGCFGGWQPRWLREIAAPVVSVVLPRFTAVSGWNLQRRGPRKVRRLVPPGAVYTLGPFVSSDRLLELCDRLWGRSLCEGEPGNHSEHLAAPDRDGYGFVLPSPWPLRREAP